MITKWIEHEDLQKRLARNESFWNGELEGSALMWITVPDAKEGLPPLKPTTSEEMWTDVQYYVKKMEYDLSHTYYAGDSLPVCHPWLGPNQFAAWLGAEIEIKPQEFTSWVTPFIKDLKQHREFKIRADNKWWKLYLELLKACAEAGKDKWITAYPDLHAGIDALCAMRGPENFMIDIISSPDWVVHSMKQMTELWKYVVDVVSDVIVPYGQGSSNWTMGWSNKKYLCVGHNDFSCLIGPEMFMEFFFPDNLECTEYVDMSIYHLDGPGAIIHLPAILGLKKLTTIQWIQGANNPLPSHWLDLLQHIQKNGKAVQLFYDINMTKEINFRKEIEVLCQNLDCGKLFIWAIVGNSNEADEVVNLAKQITSKT